MKLLITDAVGKEVGLVVNERINKLIVFDNTLDFLMRLFFLKAPLLALNSVVSSDHLPPLVFG